MRIALSLVVGISGLFFLAVLGGCCGTGSCEPNGLCNQSWYWYQPCDLIEGHPWGRCDPCAPCGVVMTRQVHPPMMHPGAMPPGSMPPGTMMAPPPAVAPAEAPAAGGTVIIDGGAPPK